MPRALTSGELISLRSDQASILWLDVDVPPVVFACRVNQTFTSLDKVIEVTFDGVTTGVYTDVLPSMTVLVGSAAGLADIGICRNRKSATSTKLFLGEHADIAWANDLHLTVIDDVGIWDREKKNVIRRHAVYGQRDRLQRPAHRVLSHRQCRSCEARGEADRFVC